MKESLSRDTMNYENDTLLLQFRFYPVGIEIEIENRSTEDITINWDQFRMTVNGIDKEIGHAQIRSNKIFLEKLPSLLTPRSYAIDLIVLTENIYTEKRLRKNNVFIKHMYPSISNSQGRKAVANLKGQVSTLFFSTQINNTRRDWAFNFSVDKIRQLPSLEWAWYPSGGRNVSQVGQSK
jgi:hypothetical protein